MSTKALAVLPGKIVTLDGLMAAVYRKKSVVVPKYCCWSRPTPAAFMINQQGHVLFHLMASGMYIHTPKKPTPPGRW